MTVQEIYRCPSCFELGKLRYQFGDYFCDRCKERFQASTLTRFILAFDAGREFERKQPTETP